MSNRSYIPGYVAKHIEFFKDFVITVNRKNRNYLSMDEMNKLLSAYPLVGNINLDSFVENEIFNVLNNTYEMNRNVFNFVSFVAEDFAISSPESIRKYYDSIFSLFQDFYEEDNINRIIELGNHLRGELGELTDVLSNTRSKLLRETLEIKNNEEDISIRERADRASHIISVYLEPLLKLVDSHANSIPSLLRSIIVKTSAKFNFSDTNVETELDRVKFKAEEAHSAVLGFSRDVADELFTLKKIQQDGKVVQNAVFWLEHESEEIILSSIGEKFSILNEVHHDEFVLQTKEIFYSEEEEKKVIKIPTKEEIASLGTTDAVHLDTDKALRKLISELPVKNFAFWLKDYLASEDALDEKNFFTFFPILKDTEYHFSKERVIVDLKDRKLNFPVIISENVKEKKEHI